MMPHQLGDSRPAIPVWRSFLPAKHHKPQLASRERAGKDGATAGASCDKFASRLRTEVDCQEEHGAWTLVVMRIVAHGGSHGWPHSDWGGSSHSSVGLPLP